MNVVKLLAGVEATLRRVKSWPGWSEADRRQIEDMCHQAEGFQRRAQARAALMKREGR